MSTPAATVSDSPPQPGGFFVGNAWSGQASIRRLARPAGPGQNSCMPAAFRIQRRVEFCETDAAGIAHFSAFFLYMEQAEHALLRHVGLSVVMPEGAGTISWPRVQASCEYTAAVKFEDLLDVDVVIERLGQKSVTYAFDFTCQGRRVARGKMTSVCCRIEHGHPPRSLPTPEPVAERLRPYLLTTPGGEPA